MKKVALLCNRCDRDYLLNCFQRHSEMKSEVVALLAWSVVDAPFYYGIPIVPLEKIHEIGCDTILVSVRRNHELSKIILRLKEIKDVDIFVVREFALIDRRNIINKSGFDPICVNCASDRTGKERPYFPHLDVHICDHCNLRCKGCLHYAPYVKEKHSIDLGKFESDIRILNDKLILGRIFLLGGEPLLEPEICTEAIGIIRKYVPETEIRIITNGLLVPRMSDSFLQNLYDNDVDINVSLYPTFWNRYKEIEATLNGKRIRHWIYKIDRFGKWLTDPRAKNRHNKYFNNESCLSMDCHILFEGRIYKCPEAALYRYLAAGIEMEEEAEMIAGKGIDINEIDNGWNMIRKLCEPCELCGNCSVPGTEFMWGQVTEIITPEDWFV